MSNKRFRYGKLLSSLFVVALIAITGLKHQEIYDWIRLQGYQPPQAIAQLVTNTTMNDKGRNLFYVNHPSLENDKSSFNSHCSSKEQTIVLGCYIKNRGIYVYDVQNLKLNGVEEVTAAHEMLHAAYDRLSASERSRVNDLIQQVYARLDNPRIKTTIEAYQKAGVDTTNELHSILGTEVRNLSPELETYYKKYFDNRLKIVGYSEQYEKVFSDEQNKLDLLLSEINTLKTSLEVQKQTLQQQQENISSQSEQLRQLAQNGQDKQYNSQVDGYNAKLTSLRQSISKFNTEVDNLNNLVNEYNQLGVEQTELFKAIDSRNAPSTQ